MATREKATSPSGFGRTTLACFASVCLSILSLLVAAFVVGPIIRNFWGAPPGFGEHFTSDDGYRQALGGQIATLSLGFLLLGWLLALGEPPPRFKQILWAVNPITVAVGFLAFKFLYQFLDPVPFVVEQVRIRNGVWLGILAPLVFASFAKLGASLSPRQNDA